MRIKGGNVKMDMILLIIYFIAGYWAVGKTIYANKIVIYTGNALFFKKLFLGMFLGWILIPVAIIKKIISK